ncbi:hypothetical protein G6M24_22460 [Agrobacterium tumefaciens]|nr:hypothetical protein [Agrobacterium tumefaciens]
MKRSTIPKSAMVYLIIGLMFTSLTPIISRYYPIPDLYKGFITGLGLMIEVIGIIKLQRYKRDRICVASNTKDS